MKKFKVLVTVEDDPFVEHSLWDQQESVLEVPDGFTPFEFVNACMDYAEAVAEDARLHANPPSEGTIMLLWSEHGRSCTTRTVHLWKEHTDEQHGNLDVSMCSKLFVKGFVEEGYNNQVNCKACRKRGHLDGR